MGVMVSSSHVVSAAPSSSGGGLLTLFLCSSVMSLTREIVLHKLLQHESFPRLQLFTNHPSMGDFHGVQSFRNRLLQRGSPKGSQALPANLLWHGLLSPQVRRSWQEPTPEWASHRVTASFRHPPAPAWGLFHGLQWISAPPWTSMGCRGTTCLTLYHELQRKALCSSVSSTSSPLLLH